MTWRTPRRLTRLTTGKVAVGDEERFADLGGREASPRGQVEAHCLGDVGSQKRKADVVFAADQQGRRVAMAPQVGDVGASELDSAQRLQTSSARLRR
jgi:hypothetical protein